MTDTITSQDGRYHAIIQNDGNLVVYDYTGRAVSWLGVDPTPPPEPPDPPPPDPPAGDIRRVRANFCSLIDPVLNRPIFTNTYPSQDADTRARWRRLAKLAGDSHYAIGNCQAYHDGNDVDFLRDGRMAEWVGYLREIAAEFFPIVFIHSGDRYPGAGYHRRFLEAVPRDLYARCIWLCGWETVKGGYSTAEFVAANREMRETLGSEPLMAAHLSDGRLSFSSHPVEPDDPWQGDEIACWRSDVGRLFAFYFCQQDTIREGDTGNLDPNRPGTVMERTAECLTRVLGTHWQGAPDWFARLDYRPIPVLWEQNEELFYRGECSRAWMLEIWRTAKALGFQGYGCGTP